MSPPRSTLAQCGCAFAPQPETATQHTRAPEEFAWHVHQTLQDWTAKVDIKASIVMALETGLLSVVFALSGPIAIAGGRSEAVFWLHRGGLLLLFGSTVLAGAVVFPQIRCRGSARSWRDNCIYFGHLRRWKPANLWVELAANNPNRELQMLSTQLVTMSRITWRKHVTLQWSMLCALLGCLTVGLTLTLQ